MGTGERAGCGTEDGPGEVGFAFLAQSSTPPPHTVSLGAQVRLHPASGDAVAGLSVPRNDPVFRGWHGAERVAQARQPAQPQ